MTDRFKNTLVAASPGHLEPMTLRAAGKLADTNEPHLTVLDVVPAVPRLRAAADVERLRFVTLARSLGLGLDDIRDILGLREKGEAPCGYFRGVLDRQVDAVAERINQLEALSDELGRPQRRSRTAGHCGRRSVCVSHPSARRKH